MHSHVLLTGLLGVVLWASLSAHGQNPKLVTTSSQAINEEASATLGFPVRVHRVYVSFQDTSFVLSTNHASTNNLVEMITLYQHPVGNDVRPHPAMVLTDPSVVWDSFVSIDDYYFVSSDGSLFGSSPWNGSWSVFLQQHGSFNTELDGRVVMLAQLVEPGSSDLDYIHFGSGGTFTGDITVDFISFDPLSSNAGSLQWPDRTMLTLPLDGAEHLTTTPTLAWNDVVGSNADSYRVQISLVPFFDSTLIVEELTVPNPGSSGNAASSYQISVDVSELQYDTQFFWRVIAENADGLSRSIPTHQTFRTARAGDLNHDGSVDGLDLGLLLGQWGSCPAGVPCRADISPARDAVVSGLDLGILLGEWGTP